MTDWIMICITAVYVVATILICYYNAQSAEAAKKQTNELIVQREEMNRPYITVTFDIIRSGLMCFIIENSGNQPAFNVNIYINDEFILNLPEEREREQLEKLQKSNMYLSIHQKIFAFIASQIQFKKIAEQIATLTISYNDKYRQEIKIDINQYAFMLIYNSPLEDISQHIKKIKENEERFHKGLLKTQTKRLNYPLNVFTHTAGENDTLKFKVYKMTCVGVQLTLKEIAERCELDIETTYLILKELLYFDALVSNFGDADKLDENTRWYKR